MSGNIKTESGWQFDFGKYRGIIISIALFLLLDASVLLFNFYVSFEIADDAVGVNLAGRQRMLSQRMAKTLFVLDASRDDPIGFKTAFDELQLSKRLFDETLNAFNSGGRHSDFRKSLPVFINTNSSFGLNGAINYLHFAV